MVVGVSRSVTECGETTELSVQDSDIPSEGLSSPTIENPSSTSTLGITEKKRGGQGVNLRKLLKFIPGESNSTF